MIIKNVLFEDILPIWKEKLWPGRHSAIEPYSAMQFLGGFDHDHGYTFKYQQRAFLAGYEGDRIVAVNSCHITTKHSSRSRGLWVDPEFRGKGFGKAILEETCNVASKLGAIYIWSFPRQSSFKTYEAVGFEQSTDWLDDGEFGPNCYALKKL